MNHDSFPHGAPEGLTTEEAAELANVVPDPRAAFEAAMAAAGYHLNPGRYRDGTYRDTEYAAGWAMWQAATKAPRWWHCDTHGTGNATAWGCPECVREMRAEIQQLRLAEEGAKTAFGHVVDSKRALEQEIAKLQYNLRAAHDIIRRDVRAQKGPL